MRDSLTTSVRGFCSGSDRRHERSLALALHGPLGATPARVARALLAALLTSVLGACGSCGAGDRPIVSVQIVDRLTAVQGAALEFDHAALEAAARQAARGWTGFSIRDARADEVGWQLTVEVQALAEREARDDAGVARSGERHRAAAVGMTLAALRDAGGAGPQRYEADGLAAADVPAKAPIDELLRQAVASAASGVGTSIHLAAARDDEVLRALSGKDRNLRLRAIGIAGDRRLSAAIGPLTEIVKNEEEDVDSVLKAVGALVAIGDERAVPALIDAGRNRPPAYLNPILFAVAQLGGSKAEGYLFTVANGHPDPDVRRNASDALAELRRRNETRAAQRQKQDGAPKAE